MPRKPRITSSTGIYHIVLRSINKHIIFEEEFDFQKFLFILNDCKSKHDVDIYAYCLMDNHIHLLLFSSHQNLSKFFQSVGSIFVRWYNNKYSRSGHLFQDRFHSIAVEDSQQYLSTLLYIHNNPVKANVCRYPSEYRWSSYNSFYGENNTLINTTYSYKIAGSKESLIDYFSRNSNQMEDELFAKDHPEKNHFVIDEEALSIFKSVTGLPSTSAVSELTRTQRNEFIRCLRNKNLTSNQIARLMNISIATVKRIKS